MLEGNYSCEQCHVMFDYEPVVCTICGEENFCSMNCMWNNASLCAEYQTQKQTTPIFTTRSVMDTVYRKIRQDKDLMDALQAKLNGQTATLMLVFYTQDLQMLCDLLSSSPDWKTILLNGVEAVPSIDPNHSGRTFILAFHCKNKALEHRFV